MNDRRCPRCGKLIIANVLCPECGLLEETHHPPLNPPPEECPLTDAERARWRRWSWVLLVLGPVMTWLAVPLGRVGNKILPAAWKTSLNYGDLLFVALGFLLVTALGAAFCLARGQPTPLKDVEIVGFMLVRGLLFIFLELAVILVGGYVVAAVFR